MYKCEIIADSVSPQKNRLTTFKVTYPRIIHAEMCRHRILSRNTASSRAIPFKKMVKDVQENPFIPIAWQKDHKGMQGSEYLTGTLTEYNWLKARDKTVEQAKILHGLDVTKQLCNRLLEPFMWTTELISGTEWENFFELRCPKLYHTATGLTYNSLKDWNNVDTEIQWKSLSCQHPENTSGAEIHIQKIAEMMLDAYNESIPKQLKSGEWHIPFGNDINMVSLGGAIANLNRYASTSEINIHKYILNVATARCARLSYQTLGDNPKIDYEADIKLHDRLLESKHLSCFEHCARAMSDEEYYSFHKGKLKTVDEGYGVLYQNENLTNGWCNNFKGFIQYRYLIENK